uniref:DH domain-containing protein n=1 Tax=Leptobrachium leishanense TaxID=445787 RepID=A0A8C5RBL9_9ANUR
MEGTAGHDTPLENEGPLPDTAGIHSGNMTTLAPDPEQVSGGNGHGVVESSHVVLDRQGLEGDTEILTGRHENNVLLNQIHSEEKIAEGSHEWSLKKDLSGQTQDSSPTINIPAESHQLSSTRDILEQPHNSSTSDIKDNVDNATLTNKQETSSDDTEVETDSEQSEHWETASEENDTFKEGLEMEASHVEVTCAESEADGKECDEDCKMSPTEQSQEDAGLKNPIKAEADCEETSEDRNEGGEDGIAAGCKMAVEAVTVVDSRKEVTQDCVREAIGEVTAVEPKDTVVEVITVDCREVTVADSMDAVRQVSEADNKDTVGQVVKADNEYTVGELAKADGKKEVGELAEADRSKAVGVVTETTSQETLREMTEVDRGEAIVEMTEADGNEAVRQVTETDGKDTVGEMTEVDRREAVEELTEVDSNDTVREMTEADRREVVAEMTAGDGNQTIMEDTEADRRVAVSDMMESDSNNAVVVEVDCREADGEVTKGDRRETFSKVPESDISNDSSVDKSMSVCNETVGDVAAGDNKAIVKDESDGKEMVENDSDSTETVGDQLLIHSADIVQEDTRVEGDDALGNESGADGEKVDVKETIQELKEANSNKVRFGSEEPVEKEIEADYDTVTNETLVHIKDTVVKELQCDTNKSIKVESEEIIVEGIHKPDQVEHHPKPVIERAETVGKVEDEINVATKETVLSETNRNETVNQDTISAGMETNEESFVHKHPVCGETFADHRETNAKSSGKDSTRNVGTLHHQTAVAEETDEEILDGGETPIQPVERPAEWTHKATDQLETVSDHERNINDHKEAAVIESSELYKVTEPVAEEREVNSEPIFSAEREVSEAKLSKGSDTLNDHIKTNQQQTNAEQKIAAPQYPTGNTELDSENNDLLKDVGQTNREESEQEAVNTFYNKRGSDDGHTMFKVPEMDGDHGNITEIIDRTAAPAHSKEFFAQALSKVDFAKPEEHEATKESDPCFQINVSEDVVIQRDEIVDAEIKHSDAQSLHCIQDSGILGDNKMTPGAMDISSGSPGEPENLAEVDGDIHAARAESFKLMQTIRNLKGLFKSQGEAPEDVSTSTEVTQTQPILLDRAVTCLQRDPTDLKESETRFTKDEMENMTQNDTSLKELAVGESNDLMRSKLGTQSIQMKEEHDLLLGIEAKVSSRLELESPHKQFFEVHTDLNVTPSCENLLNVSGSPDTLSQPTVTTSETSEASRTSADINIEGDSQDDESVGRTVSEELVGPGLRFFPTQIFNPMLLLRPNSQESGFYMEGRVKNEPNQILEEEEVIGSPPEQNQQINVSRESFDSSHSKQPEGSFVSPLWLPPRPSRFGDTSVRSSTPRNDPLSRAHENALVRRPTVRAKRGNNRDGYKRFGSVIPPISQGPVQVARTGSPEPHLGTRGSPQTGTLSRQPKISEEAPLATGRPKNEHYMERLNEEEPVGKDMRLKHTDSVVLRVKGSRSRSPLQDALRNTQRRHSKLIHSSSLLYQEYSDVALNQEIQRQKPQDSPSEEKDPGSPRLRRRLLSSQDSYLQRLSVSSADSLWQDIPQIRGSSVLLSMTRDEQKLQEAKFELIMSESLYLRSLNIAVDHFQRNGELQEVLSTQERQWLFSRLSEVRDASSDFLFDLEEEFENDMYNFQVCNVVIDHVEHFSKVYLPYVTNQSYQERTFQTLMSQNPRFQQILGRLESDSVCQRLSLKSFLILPFQRITRLRLLLQNILKRSAPGSNEEQQATKAHNALEELIRDCNKNVQRMKDTEDLIFLNSKIQFECKIFPLISQSRRLVKHGEVASLEITSPSFKWKVTAKLVHLHLFNDCLMVSRQREGGRFVVFDYALFPDVRVERCEMKIHGSQKNIFRVFLRESASGARETTSAGRDGNPEGRETEYIFRTETQSQKLRWVLALSPPRWKRTS